MFEVQMLVIVFGLFGTVMVFVFSPQAESRTFLYQESEMRELMKKDKRKRMFSRIGLGLITVSFFLQMGLIIADKYFSI
jgi:hypothetical protein